MNCPQYPSVMSNAHCGVSLMSLFALISGRCDRKEAGESVKVLKGREATKTLDHFANGLGLAKSLQLIFKCVQIC